MLARLRSLLKRPVSWGAMVFSYAGIILAVAYAASVGSEASRALDQEARDSRAAIVASGQVAIHSACDFDNKRALELRGIIKDGQEATRLYVKEGVITPAQGRRAIKESQRAIAAITLRNCHKAAGVLTADPEDAPRFNHVPQEK